MSLATREDWLTKQLFGDKPDFSVLQRQMEALMFRTDFFALLVPAIQSYCAFHTTVSSFLVPASYIIEASSNSIFQRKFCYKARYLLAYNDLRTNSLSGQHIA